MEKPQHNCGNNAGLLKELRDGSRVAMDRLILLVIKALHRQARLYLKNAPKNHTFQTPEFVFRAYLRLIDQESVWWRSRAHFSGIGSPMIRRILVNYAEN